MVTLVRSTTATQNFRLPFNYEPIGSRLLITYGQCGKILIEKTQDDAEIKENIVKIRLTQEETKLFVSSARIDVQIKILATTGEVFASKIFRINVDDALNDEVMT